MELRYEEDSQPLPFLEVARLPKPMDNVAIAIDLIPANTSIQLLDGTIVKASHTILEGHRFAVKHIRKDEGLFSWNMQFGTALKDIYPGDYIMNERGRVALRHCCFVGSFVDIVDPTFPWPSEANFDDRIVSYNLEEKDFVPAPPMEVIANAEEERFLGYKRDSIRGVGTRNYVVVFSVSSLCSTSLFSASF